MEDVSTLIRRKKRIENYCITKYYDEFINDEAQFNSLLSWEIEEYDKKLLNITRIMKLLSENNEIVNSDCIYICSENEVPHDAIYKGYSTVCKIHPGVVTYFRVIFKDKFANVFYVFDSYTFVPMR